MKKTLLLALTICLTSSAFAINWQMVGARQAALGGAGVANARGGDAQYYNPALLDVDADYDEIGTYVTAGAQGKYPEVKKVLVPNADKFYNKYNTKLDADAGAAIRRGPLYFGVRSLSSLITNTKTTNGRTYADMGSFAEVSLGYAVKVIQGVSIGADVKVIEGMMSQYNELYAKFPNGFGGLMKEIWYNRKLSTSWGVDVGAVIDFSELFQSNFVWSPKVAIVGKNLNNPKFKRLTGDKYEMGRQARIGASLHPFTERLTVTADFDLTENETIVKDIKSQQLGAGLEYLLINRHTLKIPLRFGFSKDYENIQEPIYLTAGFGVETADFNFEMALLSGDCMQEVNGHDLPNALGVAMTLSWYF